MKSVRTFMQIFAVTFLLLFAISCYPIVWQPIQKTVEKTNVSYTHRIKIPGFENFTCSAKFACNSVGCPKTSEQLRQQMNSYHDWKQALPHKSMLIAQQDGYILRFKWNSAFLKNKKVPFYVGQAWLISLATQSFDFSSVIDLGSHQANYMSNLPCSFKAGKYAHYFSKPEFETVLGQHCSIDLQTSHAYQLHKSKKLLEEHRQKHENYFTIGSTCPEKIKADTWYFIVFKLKPGHDTSTMAHIESQLIEDTYSILPKQSNTTSSKPIKLADCPYLLQNNVLRDNNHYAVCGRNTTKIWLNRICLPTKEYMFIPGIDTQNLSQRKAHCYDNTYGVYESGDGDGWFDKRTHTYDVAGNQIPITNNMLLHSTHIGDCHNMDHGNFHVTDACNWFNIGQVSSGRQCYWNKKDNTCYFDKNFKARFYPEKFLQAYYQESKKQNNYAASFDRIGRAASWVKRINNGFIQYLNYGSQGFSALTLTTKDNTKTVQFMSYPFWNIYRIRFNHVYGKLGYPISKPQRKATYIQQYFEFGWIRKYHKTKNCYLVKIGKNTPEKYCLTCSHDNDCPHQNSTCIQGYCLNSKHLNDLKQKQCLDSSVCHRNLSCNKNLCTKNKKSN